MTDTQKSAQLTQVVSVRDDEHLLRDDHLAIEEPLEIRLGYTDQQRGRMHRSISITMRTPGDDKALAVGFLFGESIIQRTQQIQSIDNSKDNVIRIELCDDIILDLSRIERHFYTTSSCGICGKASLEALSIQGAEANTDDNFKIPKSVILKLSENLNKFQPLFNQTGGNHATAAFNTAGEFVKVTEDVGRHNSMDKLIGHMLSESTLPLQKYGVIVSGRASFELMQKALMANCPLLVAVGAPSSLAVELAQEYNITLLGFLNSKGFNIYHGQQRIILDA